MPLRAVYPIVDHSVNLPLLSHIESSSESEDDGDVTALQEEEEVVEGEEGEEEREDVEEPIAGVSLRPRREVNPPSWHADYEMGS